MTVSPHRTAPRVWILDWYQQVVPLFVIDDFPGVIVTHNHFNNHISAANKYIITIINHMEPVCRLRWNKWYTINRSPLLCQAKCHVTPLLRQKLQFSSHSACTHVSIKPHTLNHCRIFVRKKRTKYYIPVLNVNCSDCELPESASYVNTCFIA